MVFISLFRSLLLPRKLIIASIEIETGIPMRSSHDHVKLNSVGVRVHYNQGICQVSVCDIDSEIGEQVSDELGAKYGRKNVLFCQCDVTDYPQYEGERK